jgi:hypothetical protein
MKKIELLIAAALCFGLAPFTPRLGPVAGALALVGLSIVMAVAASGAAASLAVAGGAVGAFASGMLMSTSPAAAGAALAGLCFAERSLRVRSRTARLVHLGAALGGGALAGTLSMSFATASLAVRGVAMTVSAVLLALPLLVEADDPVAHALDGAAEELEGETGAALREAAELRRTAPEDLLDRKTEKQARETWAALLRLTEARTRLGRAPGLSLGEASPADAVRKRVDERIGDHVKALSRAYTAAGAAKAAAVSLDDAALRDVDAAGESLEQVSRAIVDEV